MCGIAGIVALTGQQRAPQIEEIEAMVAALRHRGPDEFGFFRDRRAGLGHARLSILDLETGQQPLCNEDSSLWIVFNGEIFNYIELRRDLEQRGHRFATKSDTEVIVHAWEEWGEACFERFNGQWALALWDSRKERLVLARDRMGILPLHYCEHAGRVLFASEIKAIFAADATIPRALDPVGIDEVFTFWSVLPPRSSFQGVFELEPGTIRVYERDKTAREHTYWRPRYPVDGYGGFGGSLDAAVEATRAALATATALRAQRADVPVGCYLSGGLDSSLIAALGMRATAAQLHTFAVRFEDAEYDEGAYQRETARFLGSRHHEIMVARDDISRLFVQVVRHAERPILRAAPAPLFLLSRLAHDSGIKVVLTGEGADELFAGYDLFREAKVRRFWARFPQSKLRPRLLERLYPYLARSPTAHRAIAHGFFGRNLAGWRDPGFGHETRWNTTAALKRLLLPEVRAAGTRTDARRRLLESLPSEFSSWPPLSQDQYLEIRTLFAGYIIASQGDRMLMANSVEGRFPFLDPDVVALAASLPPEYKLKVLDEKHVLKHAAGKLIPPSVLRRKKQPYRAPDAASFVGGARGEILDEFLSESRIAAASLFEPHAVRSLLVKCRARPVESGFANADNMALVGVLSTQILWSEFVQARPAAREAIRFRTRADRLAA